MAPACSSIDARRSCACFFAFRKGEFRLFAQYSKFWCDEAVLRAFCQWIDTDDLDHAPDILPDVTHRYRPPPPLSYSGREYVAQDAFHAYEAGVSKMTPEYSVDGRCIPTVSVKRGCWDSNKLPQLSQSTQLDELIQHRESRVPPQTVSPPAAQKISWGTWQLRKKKNVT